MNHVNRPVAMVTMIVTLRLPSGWKLDELESMATVQR